ncbi:septal ring lytic transglycosylase RlpA family protein [Paracraurococcus lichenis]|uniref:Endolytic peptidoglycan transglycosylase RlpA n=1 Tax=Paracraurococcus lichenis TaxID=3064888 RepID=A0ABT9EAP1_9PROT|nr:septal ring lytic transglycosylase RlpA family protein [Paracraurococcus sp. LOR1-02]MDO9713239.1 septal ring lytic transglycosylase RlpA family protein [Paracraurococcus sp. LOR1-02]
MKCLGILLVCALVGCGWVFPAEAAGERRRGVAAHATESKPDHSMHAVRRKGHHALNSSGRGHRSARVRLTPGREVIDHSGRPQRGRASYYGRQFNGRKMANGQRFRPDSNIAASRSLPLGTVAKVKNLENEQQTTVRVEDRGPYVPGRILDVAPRAAGDLGMREQGVAPVVVEPVAVPQPDGSVKPGDPVPPSQGRR